MKLSELALTKSLDDITLLEWAEWHWADATTMKDEKRVYVRGVQRTPEEYNQAYDEFRRYLSLREDGMKRAK